MFKDHASFICLDDKTIIPVGEPGAPVSTGVRSHHQGMTIAGKGLLCLDHDYHVGGIVPSVCFLVDIPEHRGESFYNGEVHVTVKEKVFQPIPAVKNFLLTIVKLALTLNVFTMIINRGV